MRLLNILFLIDLTKTVEEVENLVLNGVLFFALLSSLLTYLTSFSFNGTLKLIGTLLTALGVFGGITLQENIFDQLFSLVHDVDQLSKY